MRDAFDVDDLKEVPAAEGISAQPEKARVNPCVTIYQYRDRWAVCPGAGQNYIFSTLGQALAEAKLFLTEEVE